MKLFSLPDGVIDRKDRAQWVTPPFDLDLIIVSHLADGKLFVYPRASGEFMTDPQRANGILVQQPRANGVMI